jgi:hypothetical protein
MCSFLTSFQLLQGRFIRRIIGGGWNFPNGQGGAEHNRWDRSDSPDGVQLFQCESPQVLVKQGLINN